MDAEMPDRLSSLDDLLLILIISFLPYKEAVRTSVLAKRWRYIYHETMKIEFNEAEFVEFGGSDEEKKLAQRITFVRFMCGWMSRFPGDVIGTFEVKLSRPEGFEREMESLIRFAVARNVKNLVLDFSDAAPRGGGAGNPANMVNLPASAYQLTTLESLKLYACGVVTSSFTNLSSLRVLSLGWVELGSIRSLLLNAPLLETLCLTNCWNVEFVEITGHNDGLRELIIENCGFRAPIFSFDVPNLIVFKYSGDFRHFYFDRVSNRMQEVYLDFGLETEFEGNGDVLCDLLHNFTSARSLTMCTYLLQVVPSGENPLGLQSPLETRHLIMKTSFHLFEFVGIRFMLRSCPELETLTFEMIPPRTLENYSPPFAINPEEFWYEKISYRCLRKTLKIVEVRGFRGAFYDLHVLQYIIRFGRVLQRLELHISPEIDQGERIVALAGADMVKRRFGRGSKDLHITIHN